MISNAISEIRTIERLKAFELPVPDFGGLGLSVQRIYVLKGEYRLQAQGASVEVEIMEAKTLWRSVVYVKDGATLMLFVPAGAYKFHIRCLSNIHNASQAKIFVTQTSFGERVSFYASKAIGLLTRPSLGNLNVFRTFFNSMFRKPGDRRLVAASIQPTSSGEEISMAKLGARDILAPVMPDRPRLPVSIIIPTKERVQLLRSCIKSLGMVTDTVFEVIVVDNGATTPEMLDYLEELRKEREIRVIRLDIPFNFSKLCNEGARLARWPVLLFLNDDVEALDGTWLDHMLSFEARADVGVVGARLLYASGALQHAGIATHLVPGPGHPWRGVIQDVWEKHPLLSTAGEVDAVTGACMMISHELFNMVGGFDETNFAVTLNDVDLCLKVRERELKVVYVPQATLLHRESQTRRQDDLPEERERRQIELMAFFNRHERFARASCFYPQNLRRDTDAAIHHGC